jgi:hypothetical protein
MQNPLPENEALRLEDLCRRGEQFTFRFAHDLLGSLQLITGYADLLGILSLFLMLLNEGV